MPVAFDAGGFGTLSFNDTITLSHTTAGSNRALYIALSFNDADIDGTTVKYNGVTMTAVETGHARLRMYYLVAPATGAHNVVASTVGLGNTDGAVAAMSFTGVDQTTPHDGLQTDAVGTTTISMTVTSETGNKVVGAGLRHGNSSESNFTAGSGQTTDQQIGQQGQNYVALTYEDGASSVTHSYTVAASAFYQHRGVAVNVRAAPPDPTPSIKPDYSTFPKQKLAEAA